LGQIVSLAVVLLLVAAGLYSYNHKRPDYVHPENSVNPGNAPKSEAAKACDEQAAHPDDAQRWAKGVADGDIVPALAVQQCTAAVNESPKEARFHFQLGRALLASRRATEAQKAFETAAAMGSCPAKFYLGDAAMDEALSSGDAEKGKLARQLLTEGQQCGFEPAGARLQSMIFDASNYGNPKIMEALWEGRIDELNEARMVVALYCRGIHDYISMEFHPASQDCPGRLSQPTITYPLDQAVAGDPRNFLERAGYDAVLNLGSGFGKWLDPVWQGDPEKYKKYFMSLGATDATIMIKKYECMGYVPRVLYGQVVAFARKSKPLWDYKETLLPKAQELFGEQLNPKPGQ
jgi:hypothetical protein